ncbi:DUF2189 domain-containing protein [Aromatoleum evansii]|uniref:DUF2189 domain-containing protein n=1 Tax=Aromatoleum evansii TaxID=59406 RepID=A0ABZ1ANC4_AROEV|nr:DUF2189 domain-containing protein [Aromatoleum evansii]NMG31202.1 DUF2189 domain-containing protein [Aromatoleum evansii]WRL47350.1 DUF2189 domain-containing protein [Aromatoleum evansii]
MDKSFNTLDRHFTLPHVRQVEASRPLQWLRMGWDDMRANMGASLSYGVIFAVLGYVILAYATDMPYLFTAAVSGFFLVGPLAAAGLYEISRRHERGEGASFLESIKGLRQHGDHLLYYGAFLAFVLLGWERLSAILFALFYHGVTPDMANFFRDVFLSGDYVHFVVSYLVVGGALAGLVFALSVVSVPMLMDRNSDMVTAMMTSARAVGFNLGAMAMWAALIVVLIGLGFATMMIGMVVLLPLVGHATWHAYKDLVE